MKGKLILRVILQMYDLHQVCCLDLSSRSFIFSSGFCEVINRAADGGVTALHMAALNGHVESVQLLLDLGASITEITVEDGTTIDLIGTTYLYTAAIIHTKRMQRKY